MKRYFLQTLILVLVSLSQSVHSQNETQKWYFGNKAGLDFSTNPPTVITTGKMNIPEGCASMCDSVGNLIVYTDGINYWNKNDSIIGTSSLGYTLTQSSVIFRVPGWNSVYYVMTPKGTYLMYTAIKYNPTTGLSSVLFTDLATFGNSTVFTSEKITLVKPSNNKRVWTITHGNDNYFYALLCDTLGFHAPVVSVIGSSHYNYPALNFKGCMKASPDGKRIGVAINHSNTCELFKFNDVTGVISDSLVLSTSVPGIYGCEFSPDGTKFYASSSTTGSIYQWNLCAGSDSAIIASQQIIGYCSLNAGTMQTAKNGKIYIANYNGSALSVIGTPNALGFACNFQNSVQPIGSAVSYYGLPNYMSSFFYKPSLPQISPVGNNTICTNESISLSVSGLYNPVWNNLDTGITYVASPTLTSTYSVAGTHTLNSCKVEATILVTVSECTAVEQQPHNSVDVRLFPNPSTGKFFIESSSQVFFRMYDAYGTVFLNELLQPGLVEKDMGYLANGFYIIQIQKDEDTKTFRLIKTD